MRISDWSSELCSADLPISGRTTIADHQTKQVSFLDVQAVPAQRTYEYRVGWLQTMEEPQSFNTVLKFSSSSKGGLGDALPAGTVRFYMKDASGAPQFIRSEEHTSELQSLMRISYAGFCMKKKKK